MAGYGIKGYNIILRGYTKTPEDYANETKDEVGTDTLKRLNIQIKTNS